VLAVMNYPAIAALAPFAALAAGTTICNQMRPAQKFADNPH